jgi:O-antigen ligase
MDEIVKVGFPIIAVLYWAIRCRAFSTPKTLTLYTTLFGVLSSNFTLFYRDIFQAYSVFLLVYSILLIIKNRIILKPIIFLLAFIGSVALSLIFNGLSDSAETNLLNIGVMLFISQLALLLLRDLNRVNAFFDYYLEFALILCFLAPLDYFIFDQRAEATFSNPNYYGYFLGLILPWSILAPGRTQRWLVFGMISIAIILTGSRAAVLMIPLSLLFYLLRLLADKRQKIITGIIYATFGVSLVILIGVLTDHLSTLFYAGRDVTDLVGSDSERYHAIEIGIAMFKDSPIYGVGWGQYIDKFSTYMNLSSATFASSSIHTVGLRKEMVSHNDFVRVLAELGIIGTIIFLVMIAASLNGVMKYASDYKYFLLAALLGSFTYSLTHNNMNNLFFWLILLLPIGFKRIMAKSHNPSVPNT